LTHIYTNSSTTITSINKQTILTSHIQHRIYQTTLRRAMLQTPHHISSQHDTIDFHPFIPTTSQTRKLACGARHHRSCCLPRQVRRRNVGTNLSGPVVRYIRNKTLAHIDNAFDCIHPHAPPSAHTVDTASTPLFQPLAITAGCHRPPHRHLPISDQLMYILH
jgi:hypothetical protein